MSHYSTLDTPRVTTPVTQFCRTRNFVRRPVAEQGSDLTIAASVEPLHEMLRQDEYLSSEIAFCGSGADNATIQFAIWLVRQFGDRTDARKAHDKPLGILAPVQLCTGTATLSTLTGVAGGEVGESERFADTITFNLGDYGSYIQSLRGRDIVAFSPADNTAIACLGIPDMNGALGIIVEQTGGTATDAAALVNRLT